MYTERELVGITKRDHNPKRTYLVVNRLQGKHVPVRPSQSFSMFDTLAAAIRDAYPDERLLLVGFAETATAIGASIAASLNSWYLPTTREQLPDVEYLCFSEVHSHATEQKLVQTDLNRVIDRIDRIIFVEDEVTTGNTILNILHLIVKTYGRKVSFSVASLLNGMDANAIELFTRYGVRLHYLVKTEHSAYPAIAQSFCTDGPCHAPDFSGMPEGISGALLFEGIPVRRLHKGQELRRACDRLWDQVSSSVPLCGVRSILVLGTEEFMYPALFVGARLEEAGYEVRSHSTTRSPIEVSTAEEYPLHERFELASLYDQERRTFLYDIRKYDKVLIITDAALPACIAGKSLSCADQADGPSGEGGDISPRPILSLLHALIACGNRDITVIRWCSP